MEGTVGPKKPFRVHAELRLCNCHAHRGRTGMLWACGFPAETYLTKARTVGGSAFVCGLGEEEMVRTEDS